MTTLADRDWRLIAEDVRGGAMNMALDEIAAETAAAGGPRTLRVYRWEPATLSLGYHQAPETVDWEFCEREGIDVVRRQTGGGGIYHDSWGDVSYSIVAPVEELPGDLMDSYEQLCEPVLAAFSRLGVDARFAEASQPAIYEPACYLRALHPAHDVVVSGDGEDSQDGGEKKVSGNAQYRRRDAVVQHGSLTYSVDANRHLAVFADPDATPRDFCERVTGIDAHAAVGRNEAVETLARTLREWANADAGEWTDDELSRAHERAEGKYATDEWNRGLTTGRATR
jgi:lipoate-protein ligase A